MHICVIYNGISMKDFAVVVQVEMKLYSNPTAELSPSVLGLKLSHFIISHS